MSYKLSFVTRKIYNDNTEKIIVKNGYMPNIEKIQLAKERKKVQKWLDLLQIKQLGQVSFDSLETEERLMKEFERKYAPKMENAIRSMVRSKQQLMDILKCNDFDFFVTLTSDKTKLDRLDDTATRKAFRLWAKNMKKHYPNMWYVAVEEYHKKGGLHYHILIGGVTAQQLGLVDSGKTVRKGRCKGQPIFNATKWQNGYSTVTKVLDKIAVKYYLSKYLTKGKIDPRFFGKKRFFTSQNIIRPIIEKFQFPCNAEADIFDSIMKEDYNIDYEDTKKEYVVLSRNL